MRIEDKISKLMCQTGACSLVLGILSVIGGLVLGIIGPCGGPSHASAVPQGNAERRVHYHDCHEPGPGLQPRDRRDDRRIPGNGCV